MSKESIGLYGPEFASLKATGVEKKETKKVSPMKVWIGGSDRPMPEALKQVLGLFGLDVDIQSDPKKLVEKLKIAEKENNIPDLIILDSFSLPSRANWEEEGAVRLITQIRNDVELKHQPAIMRLSFLKDGLERSAEAGADLTLLHPANLVDILKGISTLPELLASIEEQYGDRMAKSKEYFYKEYQDKLSQRSEITADTEQEIEILDTIFQENNVHDVLDAGMGSGRIIRPLQEKGYDVLGVDSSPELIAEAESIANEKKQPKQFFVGDAKELPLPNNSQDAIMYNWHVFCDLLGTKAKRDTLSEAFRLLREGGIIVLDIPDREYTEFQADGVYIQNPGGKRIFIGYTPSESEMVQLMKEAGFENIETKKWQTKHEFHKITFIGHKNNYDT